MTIAASGCCLLLLAVACVVDAATFQHLKHDPTKIVNGKTVVDFRVNFFGQRYDRFFIDWKTGLISFDAEATYDMEEVKSFPNQHYKPHAQAPAQMDTPLIAVYYASMARKFSGTNVTIVSPTKLDNAEESASVASWCRDLVQANVPESSAFKCDNFALVTWIGSGPGGSFPIGSVPRNNFQILLATSGDDTYAIFNYQDLSWHADSNNGGNERGIIEDQDSPSFPKVGFNAGGGRRFLSLPYSGDRQVINLSESEASVTPSSWQAAPAVEGVEAAHKHLNSVKGVYVYRISGRAEVLVGSCHLGALTARSNEQSANLLISPAWGYFLGGQEVTIRGQCFDSATIYDITFDTEPKITVPCSVVDKLRIKCVLTDWFLRRGYIPFRLFENKESTKFAGNFYATIIGPEIQMQQYANIAGSLEVEQIPINWNPSIFAGSSAQNLVVSLYGFREIEGVEKANLTLLWDTTNKTKVPTFDYLKNVGNTSSPGDGSFVIQTADIRCKTNVDCKKMDSGVLAVEDPVSKRRIWSRPFQLGWLYTKLESDPTTAAEICRMRYLEKETKRNDEPWQEAVPNCPCSQRQAEADFRFTREDQFLGFGDSTRCFISYPIRGSTGASQCCYRVDTGLLVYSNDSAKPNAIDSPMLRAHYLGGFPFNHFGRVPIFSHLSTDAILKHTCCAWSQKTSPTSCSYYKEVRATKDCSVYRTPFSASAYGLSHFKTFRGTFYQFYGKGEYVLVKGEGDELTIQGRFEQVVDITKGEPTDATGLTAIGAKIGCRYGSSKAYVQHTKSDPPGLYVYIDGAMQDHIDIRFGQHRVTRNVVESACITVVYDISADHVESVMLLLADGAVVKIKAVAQVLNIDVQLPDNSKKYPTMPRYYGLFGELSDQSRQPGADLYDLAGDRVVEPHEIQLPHRIEFFALRMLINESYQSVMMSFNENIKPSDYYDATFKASPRQYRDNGQYNVVTDAPTTVVPVVTEPATTALSPSNRVVPIVVVNQTEPAAPQTEAKAALAASPMNVLSKRRRRELFVSTAFLESVDSYDLRLTGDLRLQASTKQADTTAYDFQQNLVDKQEVFCPYLNIPNAVKSSPDTRVNALVTINDCNPGFRLTSTKAATYNCQLDPKAKVATAFWQPAPIAHCTMVTSTDAVAQQGLSTAVIIGISVGAVLLVAIVIAIFLIIRNKSSKKSKTAAAGNDIEESSPLNVPEEKTMPLPPPTHSRPTSSATSPASPTTSSPLSPTTIYPPTTFENDAYRSPALMQPPTAFPAIHEHHQSPAPVAKDEDIM